MGLNCYPNNLRLFYVFFNNFVFAGEKITLPSGGILADEMGLGKTIEVLACILSNQSDIKTPSLPERKKRKQPRSRKRKIRYSSLSEEEDSEEEDEETAKRIRIEETIESVISIASSNSKETRRSVKKVGLKQDKYTLLRKWYEDSLSSVSTTSQAKPVKRPETPQLRCYCDGAPDDDSAAQCCNCGHTLHLVCAGLDYEPEEGSFFCSDCWTKREPMPSRATFIVAPSPIFQQWISEVCL